MAYGTKTASIMDIPLKISSVVTPYLGDNGYKFEGVNSIRVLSIPNGSLNTYNEASATAPFGDPALVVPVEQLLELAYNKSMLLRIQKTQMQDIPVSAFSKKASLQNIDQVFIPAHDKYSIGKVLAARPIANQVFITLSTDSATEKFSTMVTKSRNAGASLSNSFAWVTYSFADIIKEKINYTGSDKGYTEGKNGYLGRLAGVRIVEVPDTYLGTNIYAIHFDKSAVINVTPKMDAKSDMVVLDKVPGFSGVEIQMRDRADTFVLNKKATVISSLEDIAASTTTTTSTSS